MTRIDLTAASTVHIVEPHWNPMVEAQAIDRVHRIGQSRDVEVVRYIVDGSIELVSLAKQCSRSWFVPPSAEYHYSIFSGYRMIK